RSGLAASTPPHSVGSTSTVAAVSARRTAAGTGGGVAPAGAAGGAGGTAAAIAADRIMRERERARVSREERCDGAAPRSTGIARGPGAPRATPRATDGRGRTLAPRERGAASAVRAWRRPDAPT